MTKVTARAIENIDVLHRLATPAEGDTGAGVGRELGRDKSNFAKTLGLLREDGYLGDGLALTPAGHRVVRLFRQDGEIRVPGDILDLRHRELEPDPDNERTEIPEADIDDMADSLVGRGQLQPIRVRAPKTPGGKHRILIGELRWRGVGRAIERGAWPADRPMRCQLVSETDALTLVLMRMDENLRRKDLHPLDEGRGFKRLRDEFGQSTDEIAARLGRSRRHVQDRITVFERTDAETQARMRLPESHPQHVRYTDARDDATRHKPAQQSPDSAEPASPPPPHLPSAEEGPVAADAAAARPPGLPADALQTLHEIAHKIAHDPAVKGSKVAQVYGHHTDSVATFLRDWGYARFFQHGPIWVAVLTDRASMADAVQGKPVRGVYITRWLNKPPKAPDPEPRSAAHALVGDDFSRQLRDAAAQVEPVELPPALADEIAPFPRHLTLSFGRSSCTIDGALARLDLDGWPFRLELADVRALRDLLNDVITELGAREIELSETQKRDLIRLVDARAHDESHAVTIFDHPAARDLVPGVVAVLQQKGLAGAAVKTRKGRRMTVYWLTEAGLAMARQLGAQV